MRGRRPAAVPLGPAATSGRAPAPRRSAGRCSTTPTTAPVHVSIRPQPRGRRAVRAAPAPARPDAGRRRGGRRGRRRARGDRVTALLHDGNGRVCGVRGATGAGGTELRRQRDVVVGADGIRSTVARSGRRAGRASRGRARQRRPLPLLRRPAGRRLRVGLRRRGGRGADPDQRRADLRLRRHQPRAPARACAALGAEAALRPRWSTTAAPALADRVRPRRARRQGARLERHPRLRAPSHGVPAGRWSATPATSRTRSPPTA